MLASKSSTSGNEDVIHKNLPPPLPLSPPHTPTRFWVPSCAGCLGGWLFPPAVEVPVQQYRQGWAQGKPPPREITVQKSAC